MKAPAKASGSEGSKAEAAYHVRSEAPAPGHGFVDGNVAGELGLMDAAEAAQEGA